MSTTQVKNPELPSATTVKPHTAPMTVPAADAATHHAATTATTTAASTASTTRAKTDATLGGRPLDTAGRSDFDRLAKQDKGNDKKLATDVGTLIIQHEAKGNATNYDEELLADANKHQVLAQSLASAGRMPTPGMSIDLNKAVTGAVDKGAIKGTDVIDAARKDPTNAQANTAADAVTHDAAAAVDAAKTKYEAAVDAKSQLDQQLAVEVAKVAPGITGPQLTKFEDAFKKEHDYSAVSGNIDKQAANLDTTLEKDLPTLEAAAKDPPKLPGPNEDAKLATDSAVGALADLADSNKAFDAIKKTTDLMSDPTLAKAMAAADGGKYQDSMNAVLAEGLPRVAAQLMLEQKDKGEADAKTKEQILGMAGNLEKGLAVTDRTGDGAKAISALKAYWFPDAATQKELDAKKKVVTSTDHELAAVENQIKTLESDVRIFKATGDPKLAGKENELAAAQHELHAAQGDAHEAEKLFDDLKRAPLEGLEKFATHGASGGMKQALGVIGLMDYAADPKANMAAITKVLFDGGDATRASAIELLRGGATGLGLAGRFVPGVGMAAAGLAMAQDWSSGTAGGKVSAAGDFMSMVGNGLEATGTVGDLPGAAIGAVLDAVGIGVSLVGGFMGKGDPVADDATKLLEQQGIDPNLASGLGHSNVGVMDQLDKMGVTRAQIDNEATSSPNLLSNKSEFDDLQRAQNAMHIKPQDWDQMVQTMMNDEQKRHPGDPRDVSQEVGDEVLTEMARMPQAIAPQMQALAAREHLTGAAYTAAQDQMEDKLLASDLEGRYRDLAKVK